ncbi:deubiquitinating enzyme [Cytospora paraplurivora]|uniref:Ubiquitin carboxyl-terminal hydrolase n=1 Tax=Cytospora paraplurivora TaxID=2898453 RepID=A0AAN9UCC7_9PEZI
MAAVNVVIKHQGNKYDVEVDPAFTGEEFKEILYSLTGVEPDRQKILVKGGQLKNDADMGKLGLKNGQQIMMLGTPSAGGGDLLRPKEKIKFLEDMTDAEAAQQLGAVPSGLTNLGNTCYLNSTLQALRAIPELQESLVNYEYNNQDGASIGALSQFDLTTQLKKLYKSMGETQQSFAPFTFIQALRQAYPQFAERSRTGEGFAQQDAEEAWTNILSQVRNSLQVKDKNGSSRSWVDKYMSLQLVSKLECDESEAREGGEQPIETTESFLKLNCHIDSETNHLRDGILAGLKEKIEKRSEVLGRNASYTKTSKISRLPVYLTVHFVRFFWRRDTQKKAKILRKVTFPKELDIMEFCADSLKEKLVPVRDRLREVNKDEEDIERARKRRRTNPASEGEPSQPAKEEKKNDKKEAKKAATDGDGDTPMETYKTDAEWEEEKAAALRSAKRELLSLVNQDLAEDEGANQSGLYELRGVVTHQGSSADSGHYTAYVKKPAPKDPKTGKAGEEDGNWYWFNDDKVSEVPGDKIETLAGGGETHSALILLYKAIPLPTADEVRE